MNHFKLFLTIATIFLLSGNIFGQETKKVEKASVSEVQKLIDSTEFMKTNGLVKLKELSLSLSEKEREELYYSNKKIPQLGLLGFAVPSLGNWLVGDKEGAVNTLIFTGVGLGVYTGGVIVTITAARSANMGVMLVGFIIGYAGIGIVIGYNIYSP